MFEFLLAVVIVAVVVVLLLRLEQRWLVIKKVPAPEKLSVTQVKGNAMSDTLTYEIVVASPAVNDVTRRELTVTINGLNEPTAVYPADAVNLGYVTAPQDAEVMVNVVDVDDAGNRSEPATLVFTAADVVPPPAPGGVSVVLVGENVVPPATLPENPVADEEENNA